jgi:dTMP kinase
VRELPCGLLDRCILDGDGGKLANDRLRDRVKQRGVLITLEGIDGTGKTTQARRLATHLRRRGYAVALTREPGGTPMGERIRAVLLAGRPVEVSPLAELLLMYAARAEHLEQVIQPALARGEIVVSDRFNDASLAYQGYGRRLSPGVVSALDRLVCRSTQPDLTILLDLDPHTSLRRAESRGKRRHGHAGRFEAEGLQFQRRVRSGYLEIARRNPRRVRVVKAGRTVAEVQAEIRRIVDEFLAGVGQRAGIRRR